uniref:Protocadherin-15 isoform X2 n=2 Tax=Petromyzon marinus TaxID=7757 RepID=A0AAJ7WPL9_PETMA|nr:protocadherin-15 isoform X2 [Petromyzon marinus]XP_032805505.1 protocadherin-15 isoform X2 [Petromyzon marinus]XP_032805507.1 protocadherin-15 isoform X2 [Petromyzon marinus]XP_032805508.1 protocadherin-15 isoform X2 [Petromyzon marinus]
MVLLNPPTIWLLCFFTYLRLKLAQSQDDCRLDRSGPPVTIVTIDEESPDGTVLVDSMHIKGIASGPSPTISLALLLNENQWVRLDPALQRLYLNTAGRIFDRDPPISIQSLTVIVQCQNLNVGSTINHEVKILVRDINDNPPIFQQRSYNMSVNELAPVGTTIFTGFATLGAVDIDDGANGQIEYSILYNPRDPRSNNTFDIPLTLTGAVILRERLNYEDFQKYSVIVQASDRCPNVAERKSSTTTLSIEVLDGDDLGPMFLPCIPISVSRDCRPVKYFAAIPELARPTLVNPINVTPPIEAIDQDRNIQPPTARPGIIYSILIGDPGNYSDYFNLNGKTAELQLLQPVNRDMFPQFDLVLKAEQDNGHPLPAYAALHIEILNENNQAPYFERTMYQGYILESAPVGTTISSTLQLDSPLSVVALDADVKETKDPQLQVSLQGASAVFGVTSSGITRFLTLLQPLDRETRQQYSFTMMASDGVLHSGPANVTILVLDANDNTPVFTSLSYIANAYSNMIPGDPVIQLLASDADSGVNGNVHYQILAGDQGQFVINNVTGLLSVAGPSGLLVGRTFTLTVQASDGAPPADRRSSIATVYVEVLPPNNQSPPSMPFSFYSMEVSEALSAGAFLLSVQAVDRENDPIVYSIKSGNPDGAFYLNSSTGILSLWKSLDRETRDQYQLILTASDGHPNGTSTATVAVLVTDVNDNDPTFDPLMPTNFSVYEGRTGVFVGQVRATDKDAGMNGEVVYSLDNYAAVFAIMANGSIYTKVALDREKQETYMLTVVASDRALYPRHTSLPLAISVLDVNDNPPIFSQSVYNVTVPENGSPGQLVLRLEASDADMDASTRYQLLTAGMSKLFSVDDITGQLAVLQSLDYETTPGHKYTLLVKAIDAYNSNLTSLATVYVNIKDMNDFAPNFTMLDQTGLVAPDAHRGTYIISVLARDPDPPYGGIGVIQYAVDEAQSSGSADLFMVEENTGRILTKVNLNEDPNTNFKLVVLALDGGDPVMTSSTTVTITVLQPSVIPRFTQEEYRSEPISEYATIGTSVVMVTASAINQTITYSITAGNNGDTFIIESKTGVIRTNKPLDFESTPQYQLEVQADSLPTGRSALRSTSRSNSAIVIVYVKDENDNAPIFNQTLYLGGVTEETRTFTSVLQVKADDRDSGNNSMIAYKLLLPSSTNEGFIIEPLTGIVKTAMLFYNMRRKYYRFQVMGVDRYGAGLSGTSEVVISVVNELDMQVIVSAIPPAVVENNKDQLMKIIERYIQDQIPGAKLVVDSIGPRQYGEGYLQEDYTNSDVAVYAIDPMTNRAISSKELFKILDGKLLDINKEFQASLGAGARVQEIRSPAVVQSVQKQAQALGYTEGALIALSVIIIICCIPAILIVIVTYKQFKERQAECAKNARIQSALPTGKTAQSPIAQQYDEAGDNTGNIGYGQQGELSMESGIDPGQEYYPHDYYGYEATGYGVAGFGSRRRLIAAPQRMFNEYGEPIVEDEGDYYYGEGGGLGEDGELMHEGHTQEKAVGQKKKGRHKKQVSPAAAEGQPETGHSGSERPSLRQDPQMDAGEIETGDSSPSAAVAQDYDGLPASQMSARRGRILPSNNISPENHDVENQPIFSKIGPDDFSDKQPILQTQMHWKKAKLFPMFFRKIKGQVSKPQEPQQISNGHSSKASSSSELVLINGNYFQKAQNGAKPKTFGIGGVLKKVSKGTGKYLKKGSSISDKSVKSVSDTNEGSIKKSLSSQGSMSSTRSRDHMSAETSSNLSEQGSRSRASSVSNTSLRSRSQTISRTASVFSEEGSESNATTKTNDNESDDLSVLSEMSDRSALSSRQMKSVSGSVSSKTTSTKSKVSFGDSDVTVKDYDYSQRSSLSELPERDNESADSMSDSEDNEDSQSRFSSENGQKERSQHREDSDSEDSEDETQQSEMCSVDYTSDASRVAQSKRSIMSSIHLNRSFSRGFSTDTDAILDDHESLQQSHEDENEVVDVDHEGMNDGFEHPSVSGDETSKSRTSVETTELENDNSESEHADEMGSRNAMSIGGSEDITSVDGSSIYRSLAETSDNISVHTSGACSTMSVVDSENTVESSSDHTVRTNDFKNISSVSSISDFANRSLPMTISESSEEEAQMSDVLSVTDTQSLQTSSAVTDARTSGQTDPESSHQDKTDYENFPSTEIEETEGSDEEESFTGDTEHQVGSSLPESDSTVTVL